MPASDRILATKLLAPRIGTGLIRRPRLLDLLEGYQLRKLTLITAPAGYGKTVLATQFAEHAPWPVSWYQLDHFDNDLALFVQHLSAGIARQLPGFGTEVIELVEQSRDPAGDMRRLIASLVNSIAAALGTGLILIIDDYHTIDEPVVHAFLEHLLEYLPEKLHIILSGRTIPPLNLAKLKMAGLMLEVGQDDLQFNRGEIARFIVEEGNEPVSGEIITLLEAETGGWPAALRLSGFSLAGLKGRQKETAARSIPRREIYQYLAAEVLQSLPEDLYNFMVATSILDIITPAICNQYLERSDSRNILETIAAKNLFITVLEGQEEIFRYHHLFREVLQNRLGESRTALLIKAGRCYLQAGYPARAVEVLLQAGDYEEAVPAIELAANSMLQQNRWQTVQRWLRQVPERYKENSAWLLLFEGAVILNSGNLERAEPFIDQAAAGFEARGDRSGFLQTQLYRARLLRLRGSYDHSLQLLEDLAAELARQPVVQWYVAVLEQASLLGMQGNPDPAVRLLKQALNIAEREGEERITAQLAEKLGELYYIKGDYARALEVHQRAAEMAVESDRLSFSLRDTIALIYRDWGDLDQALEYANNSIKTKEELGMIEALPFAYHQLAVICADLGRLNEAAELFQKSIDLARRSGGDSFFLALSLVLYGRLLAGQGQLTEALALVEEALAAAQGQSVFIHAICLQAAAPVFTQVDRLEQGEIMLKQAVRILEQVGAKYPLCLAYGEMAAVHRQSGAQAAARHEAARCLELAAAGSYIQLFLSNQAIMLPVIEIGFIAGIEPEFVEDVACRLGSAAFAQLVGLAGHSDPAVRLRVVGFLARAGSPEAASALEAALHDPDEQVRDRALAAVRALSRPGENDGAKTEAALRSGESRFPGSALLNVQCLGPFRVIAGEHEIAWRTTKARDLFAYLVHHRAKPVVKEKILEELWPEVDPEHASTLFHTNLYQLRKAVKGILGEQRLVKHTAGQYRLDSERFACDIDVFESLSATASDQPAGPGLEQAAALYRGEYLEGLDYEWIAAERERLNQLYQVILDSLARFYLDDGRFPRAASCLRSILKINPLLEEAHALLMTAYARMGDRMAVLQQYETLNEVLAEELGVDPSPKTRELYYKLCGDEEA
ncbi:MAG: tetratricopeptide repeat protein [Bacillota bacterium]